MSNIMLATKTIQAIDAAIAKDQGATFRRHLQTVLPHIGDAYRGEEEGFRSHMGASGIGAECGRAIWYNFRWFTKSNFPGRIMRLFNRGHLEEGRFIAALLTIGVQVFQQDEHGKQFRISAEGGHFGGSGDGVLLGVPDLPPNEPALAEFKTHNDASFKALVKEGVRGAKFEHYVQMNMYMRKMGIRCGLYMAVNKNNDELYGEILFVDTATADQFLDRAHVLVFHKEPPAKIGKSAGWYGCKWCDHKPVCHLGAAPAVNCRTCRAAQAMPTGEWICGSRVMSGGELTVLDKAMQNEACDNYVPIL